MKLLSAFVVLSCIAIGAVSGLSLGGVLGSVADLGSGLVGTISDVGSGVAKTVINIIPTPAEVWQAKKEAFAAFPFEIISNVINQICSQAIAAHAILPRITPDINKMNFQLKTACSNYTFPISRAEEMWRHPAFDANKKIVLFATGWTNSINQSDPLYVLSKPYFCRNDVNFIALDAANYVTTFYSWSALNTDEIGKNVAIGLSSLIGVVPVERIHLIGHSLGAHIVGAAARYFHELTGQTIERVTGLDPAKPCFNEGSSLSGLLRGYSKIVDVIHSNPGILGIREPVGDIDFYPGGLVSLAPGTFNLIDSHMRAVEYYAESVYPGNEQTFQAIRCNSLDNVKKCPKERTPMGFAASLNLKGSFFLDINSYAPFGKGVDRKRSQENTNCGICKDDDIY